jgi:predicted  nucleic acid-binding Zn-ribbon protein
MAFDGFIPQEGLDGPLAASERAYVDNLVAVAQASGGLPVLSCTRSLGRARALRRALGGRTVTIHRNLFHQWASYCSLAQAGNAYFVETVAKTVAASGHDPFLRGLASYFDLHEPGVPSQEVFQVFILLHLYIEGFAFDAADLVVDTTEIATDPEARQRAEQQLSGLIRHPVDLSDVRHVCELPDLKFAWSPTVRDSIEQFAKLIPRAGRSAESADFVERIKEQALIEWERFEFFNRGTRSVLTARIDDLESRLNAEVAVGTELRAAKDGLEAALAEKARTAEAQTDALAQQVAAAESEQRDLQARVHALSSERDDLATQAAAAAARIDSLEKTLALHIASAERETLDLRARVDALSTERDDLATTAATAATRIDDLQSRVDALSAERDELATNAATAAARIESLEQELAEWAGLKTLWRRLSRKPHGSAA